MKDRLIKKEIEEFKNRRLGVYKADPDQIVRDTRVAERATKDHVGRWLFELLQNSDDARASEVQIVIDERTIYVADNGHGLKPEAVSAISGTDFSDKTTGTIGRKGVGFKSVYEVSQNPQMLTVDGEGIEFSPEKTRSWLLENRLNDGHVPYQWIPFFISWDAAKEQDSKLEQFKDRFKTVVRLPGVSQDKKQKVEQLLKEWPPHCLFAFRHLRKITGPGLEVKLTVRDSVWSLHDSRGQTPVEWRVAKYTELPSEDLLQMMGADERRAVSTDGVSFLIAAPLETEGVVPTSEILPIHVFYPTEEKGPVRLLLHAEFLVKSDRTAIISINDNPFNAWVADRLAYHVCKFVNDTYCPKAPNSQAALLLPFADRTSHPVAENLWRRVANEAKKCLRLADANGCQRLSLDEARLISVSVRPDLARTLLEATSLRTQLLYRSFDNDKEAHTALRELGCKEIHDRDLMEAIDKNADTLAADTQWVWACWQWLAAWVAKEPYGEKHGERIKRIKELPIVPVDGSLRKALDLSGRIVSWKPDAAAGNIPDWLPLTFVADWFRDRIQNEAEQESPVKKLFKELGFDEPGEDVIQRAVGLAIEQYWKDEQGDPERFLCFIQEQDWHETADALLELKRCPVPLSRPAQGKAWAEAGKAYFGEEWENVLLTELYSGIESVAWVANSDVCAEKKERLRRVLEWLGVAYCPRIVEESKDISTWQLPEKCEHWKQYLYTATDHSGRHVERVAAVSRMDHLAVDNLDVARGVLLIRLVAKHWESYYRNCSQVEAKGRLSREQCYRSWQVKAKWWWEVCERLPLPKRGEREEHIALTKLWLPDKRTERAIGDLLPVINLDAFEEDKDIVRNWLVNVVSLRERIEQLTIEEWKEILSKRIPDRAPLEHLTSDERLRDKVTTSYVACLDTVAEQENVSERAFASCPLLCQKGDTWQYVEDEPRYLNDDNYLGTAFAGDIWLFYIPVRLFANAEKYFGVLSLSRSVEVNVTPEYPQSPLLDELNMRFSESLPYVWTWRSSQSKQATDRLLSRLKSLNVLVVPALKARLSLDGLHQQTERRWHVNDHTIYLHKDHANEVELAQALAKALDVRSEAEADFYENLLRCTNDRQRREKLLSKGIADAEIDRCLREYFGPAVGEEYDEGSKNPTEGEPVGGARPEDSSNRSRRLEQSQPAETSVTPGEPGLEGASSKSPDKVGYTGVLAETSTGSDQKDNQPLRLKDPKTTHYRLESQPSGSAGRGAGTGGSGDGGGTAGEGRSLTEAEKAKLEKAGRAFAVRALEDLGYSVEEMPQGNPGYDLRAKKDGGELRVEVKAHNGRATVVEITHREYKEYLTQQGYRWELWNVEHLAADNSSPVVITRYDQIPDDALDARTFRVELKKCQIKMED